MNTAVTICVGCFDELSRQRRPHLDARGNPFCRYACAKRFWTPSTRAKLPYTLSSVSADMQDQIDPPQAPRGKSLKTMPVTVVPVRDLTWKPSPMPLRSFVDVGDLGDIKIDGEAVRRALAKLTDAAPSLKHLGDPCGCSWAFAMTGPGSHSIRPCLRHAGNIDPRRLPEQYLSMDPKSRENAVRAFTQNMDATAAGYARHYFGAGALATPTVPKDCERGVCTCSCNRYGPRICGSDGGTLPRCAPCAARWNQVNPGEASLMREEYQIYGLGADSPNRQAWLGTRRCRGCGTRVGGPPGDPIPPHPRTYGGDLCDYKEVQHD